MPGIRDKIIINSGNLAAGDCAVDGNAEGIQEQFATAGIIAEEIEKANLLGDPTALGFRDSLEDICKTIDAAQDRYITAQTKCRLAVRDLTDQMRRWFDSSQFPPPTP